MLLKDVQGVGRKYDIKDFSDGYARNFLIARKLAEPAKEGSVKQVELMKKQKAQKSVIDKELTKKTLETLKETKITLSKKANEKGHLFSAIKKDEVVVALKEQTNIELSEEMLDMDTHLKDVGEHKISIKLEGKQQGEFMVEILALK